MTGRLGLKLRRLSYQTAVSAGLILASVAICLLALEAGVRIWNRIPVFAADNFVALDLDRLHGPKNPGAEYDARVGWVQRPDKRFDGFTTGAFGVRMPSTQIVPLQQGAILVVGDSFAVGSDVPDGESWPAQLERALGKQIINAAVGGYGLDQTVLRAEMLLPLLKPRVLLVQTRLDYAIWMSLLSVNAGAPKPYFTVKDGKLALQNEPVPRVASSSRDIGLARSVFGHSYLVQYMMTRLNLLQWWVSGDMRTNYVVPQAEAVEVNCLLMDRLAKIRDQNGLRLVLVVQYSGSDAAAPELPWEADRARILGCAEEKGLEVIDTLETLRSVYQAEDLPTYQKFWHMQGTDVYGHMTAEGNRLIANLVAQKLARSQAAAGEH